MKTAALLTGCLLLLAGCIKETSWPLQQDNSPKLVVDALLTDKVGSQNINLRLTSTDLNEPGQVVSGAGVVVSTQDSVWTLPEDVTRPGHYLMPSWFYAVTGNTYTLLVSKNGQVWSAKSEMKPGAFFPELKYVRDDSKGLYYVDWVANAFSTGDAAMWELLLDWSGVPGYTTADSLKTHARMLFYTLPTLDVSEVFAPQVESVFFPAGTVINERRYSLSDTHAAFIRELLLETNWTGGMFSVAAANVTSNLSNGAVGFFGVSAVNELSVTVGEKK